MGDYYKLRTTISTLEDKNQKVQIYGLTKKEELTAKKMQDIVDFTNIMRTTNNTVINEATSVSHEICNFILKIEGKNEDEEYAKISLVDLAGSERAKETKIIIKAV